MKFIDRLEEWLTAGLLAAATLVIFVAVLVRYATGIPALYPIMSQVHMTWAQELCVIMLVWAAKIGAAYGVRTGIHVGVDVLVTRLPVAAQSKAIAFSALAGATFTGFVGTVGAWFVIALTDSHQVTPDLEWPMWAVYLAIPVASYLMCWRFLQAWRAGLNPSQGMHA